MTTAEMLTAFRFRMEDPDGEKWDSGSVTQVYNIFTLAQSIAVDSYFNSRRFNFLSELVKTTTIDFNSGPSDLPSDHYRPLMAKNDDGDDILIAENYVPKFGSDTDYLREDDLNEYLYIIGNKIYLKGSVHSSGTYTYGYINSLTDIDANNNPVTSQRIQDATLAISTWIAWGIDRQFDRQNEVGNLVKILFGIELNNDSVPRS